MVLGSHSSCLLSPRAKLEEKRKKEEEKRIREEEKRLREEEKVAWLPALPLLDTGTRVLSFWVSVGAVGSMGTVCSLRSHLVSLGCHQHEHHGQTPHGMGF